MRGLAVVGRVVFALLFVMTAFGHMSSEVIEEAAAHGVPLAPVLVPLAGLVAGIGGAMVMVGYRARFGAFLLLLYLVPVTFVMYPFWAAADRGVAAIQQAMFVKNTSLIGASLMIMYWGSGPYSLDG